MTMAMIQIVIFMKRSRWAATYQHRQLMKKVQGFWNSLKVGLVDGMDGPMNETKATSRLDNNNNNNNTSRLAWNLTRLDRQLIHGIIISHYPINSISLDIHQHLIHIHTIHHHCIIIIKNTLTILCINPYNKTGFHLVIIIILHRSASLEIDILRQPIITLDMAINPPHALVTPVSLSCNSSYSLHFYYHPISSF
ncbi:hypothetical protein BC941DRAFT_426761 [Chlamydoabsidia padenii]|nr:hypothetical protein BC941DRAFT_426761 [Chlamydoabsidia padenii]